MRQMIHKIGRVYLKTTVRKKENPSKLMQLGPRNSLFFRATHIKTRLASSISSHELSGGEAKGQIQTDNTNV